MEENKRVTPKLMIVSVLIATVLTGISVAFGYFIWNSMQNTNISFTVSGAIVYLDDGADIKGANLVPASGYSSVDAIKKSIKLKLKDDVTDPVTVNIKLNVNSLDDGLKKSSFKYLLLKDGTTIKEGDFASYTNPITLATLSSDNTNDNLKLTTILSEYMLYIWIDGTVENDASMQNQSFDFTITVDGDNSAKVYMGANYVKELAETTEAGAANGVYKVSHDEISSADSVTGNIIPAVDDYRYYGANPDNYICLKFNSDNTCPDKYLYRIIGSIYDELEGTNKLKVIKANILKASDGSGGEITKFAWNQTMATNDASYRQNIWAPVTDSATGYSNAKELPSTGRDNSGSTLMEMLNSEGDNGLWWGGKSGTMYYIAYISSSWDSSWQMQTKTVDFSGDEYKMESEVLDMISNSRYYLAGHNSSEITSDTMYAYERTKTGYNNGRYNNVRPYYWDGKVAIMYPSDYGYAAGEACATRTNLYNYSTSGCMNTDWLWYTSDSQWLLSPHLSYTDNAFDVSSTSGYAVYPWAGRSVRPVFNLTSDVIIVGGSGTSSSPYQITKGS